MIMYKSPHKNPEYYKENLTIWLKWLYIIYVDNNK